MSFLAQQHPLHLSQTKVIAILISMMILAMSVTNVFLLSFAQAANLHSHSDSQCNHVHPKPNDVSVMSHKWGQINLLPIFTKNICKFDILCFVSVSFFQIG
jgi:hypothetical protein